MAAWLYQPVVFQTSREFNCEGFTPTQCQYYKEPWHNWYVADLKFALPTVAFLMCTIGVFIIGYAFSQLSASNRRPRPPTWNRSVAAARYLSYQGFYIQRFDWLSAPVGALLLGALGIIYFFCMDLAPSPYYWPGPDTVWGNSPPLGTRSGWLALACMPFVFATASKANWITLVTGVTHEKLQIFHRWIAYAFFVLALMHTFPFIVWHVRNHDMVEQFTVSNIFEYWTGIVALFFQAWLTFASWGPIRNFGYEFFKASHFLSVVVFVVVFFWHCGGTLTSWDYFVATAAVYVPCWTYPWLRTLFEYGTGQKAQINVEENGFVRITIPVTFTWRPGQHCFLRLRSFGIHAISSHPFTICSLPSTSPEKPSEITFYIRPRGGFTSKLYEYGVAHPGDLVPVFVDGPYGGIDSQRYFGSDRLVVVAGGSGAGWMLPFIEQYLRYQCLTATQSTFTDNIQENKQPLDKSLRSRLPYGPRSLRVILATKDLSTRTWFYAALHKLLADYQPWDMSLEFGVKVHLTRNAERILQPPAADLERSSLSSAEETSVKKLAGDEKGYHIDVPQEELRGRPNLPVLVQEEARAATDAGDSVGIFVCGPLTMQNDVRNAVANENMNIFKRPRSGGVYLHLEHFSWA